MHIAKCPELKVLDATLSEGGGSRFIHLRLESPAWTRWRPGQFVMLRPSSFGLELPWARPFSICHASPEHLDLLIQVVGRGTARIAELTPGDRVLVWGPLGNGFSMERGAPTLLLAGGIGIAPFVGYARVHPQPDKLTLLFGHRVPLSCYPMGEMPEQLSMECRLEEGPEDLPAFLAEVKEQVLSMPSSGLILCCGPEPFLRYVHSLAERSRARIQLSLENRMACGVGACLGCVSRDATGWPIQVCSRGPVFWADQLTFAAE